MCQVHASPAAVSTGVHTADVKPSGRASQPKGVREAVLEANGEGCTYCSWENAEAVDHLVPHDEGGRDDITNLVPACRSCNSSKRNRTGLPHDRVTSELACPVGQVGRMSLCPSPIRKS
ncbi:HNH endonuclease, partial [Streptomyces sp. NPDC059835]|uniref:HNH endonuclease n=1 Tax=Streptomyces sp. NPDC059835 TaxID=3346967 RepID=UPI0036519A36